MRVLLLLGTLQVGGAERNVVALAGALRDVGVDVALCTLTRERDGAPAVAAAEARICRSTIPFRAVCSCVAYSSV